MNHALMKQWGGKRITKKGNPIFGGRNIDRYVFFVNNLHLYCNVNDSDSTVFFASYNSRLYSLGYTDKVLPSMTIQEIAARLNATIAKSL